MFISMLFKKEKNFLKLGLKFGMQFVKSNNINKCILLNFKVIKRNNNIIIESFNNLLEIKHLLKFLNIMLLKNKKIFIFNKNYKYQFLLSQLKFSNFGIQIINK